METGEVAERLTIVRLDPAAVHFRVHYDPVSPRPVSGWAERLQRLLIVNGGYFTPQNETAGLLISGGRAWGTSYGDFAGMFAVSPDGRVSVRWLRDQPYNPDEPLKEALQSFPVLVKPGGVIGFPADADDGRPARRTVVAQDLEGRILFIVAPRGYLSLHELAGIRPQPGRGAQPGRGFLHRAMAEDGRDVCRNRFSRSGALGHQRRLMALPARLYF